MSLFCSSHTQSRATLGVSLVLFISIIGLWGFSGCSGGGTASAPMQQSNIKPLAMLYGQFIGQHQGRPPASEEEFRKFIQERGMGMLKQFGISSVDALFISERDKQPYVVIYGQPKGPAALAGQPVCVYERQGVGGRRYVASSLGAVEEVDESRFRQLVPE
jgi:hypothetical protein